jgi:hypothetical protein
MKFRFAGLVYVAILLAFFTGAGAQPYRQLTVDDFQGVPANRFGTVAYTHCSIEFSYTAKREKNYYILNFNILLTLNKDKSWVDKARLTSAEMMAEILKHEQGHYIIAYMEQQELQRTVGKTVFYADYQYQAGNIFDRIDAKYKQLNLDYDTDTRNSTNREQQRSWDAYFEKKLAYMPPG